MHTVLARCAQYGAEPSLSRDARGDSNFVVVRRVVPCMWLQICVACARVLVSCLASMLLCNTEATRRRTRFTFRAVRSPDAHE